MIKVKNLLVHGEGKTLRPNLLYATDGKLRDSITMGTPDTPLEDKQVTVVYGPELVNINSLHFSCNCKEVAQVSTVIIFAARSLFFSPIPTLTGMISCELFPFTV
ncbi:hypothetical protein TNCT_87761 [Trichonephila clavata]|uniref:PLC-beta PH domain-containing protein n=1 Tax=Trichonephila clavata TaxID=2740835 RepID=A0A8X6H064_TRICU|nr:hypothetical protein TNCT_87761 [Trichonephila clavata]